MFAVLKKYFSPVINHDEELCLVQIFKPLYVILSVAGLFPLAVEFPDGKQKARVVFKQNTINSACTLFMILTIHVFFVFHLFELNASSKDNSMTEDKMTAMNYVTDLVLQVFFCTVSYFYVIRDRSLYITLLNDMSDCWDRLAKGKRGLILGRLRVLVNCTVLGSLFLISLELIIATYTGDPTVWKMMLISLTFVVPEIIQFLMIAFYFVMILMVIALLKNIEEQFRINLGARNFWDCVKPDLGDEVAMPEIMEVYVKTLGIKRQINAAFQAPILVALMVSFHEVVSMPHLIYHGLTFQSSFSTHDVVECSCWLLNQLIKIYALAHSGTMLKSQVNKIGRTLHKIPISGNQDLKVFLEVQHFSSMISFQNPEITVYGYFPLDATLMFNVIASAVMYLVILVQLDKP